MGDDAPAEKMLQLWTRLGDICLDNLGDTEAATEAYQVACELAPDDIARHEQLADLYLEAGEARRHEAIVEGRERRATRRTRELRRTRCIASTLPSDC